MFPSDPWLRSIIVLISVEPLFEILVGGFELIIEEEYGPRRLSVEPLRSVRRGSVSVPVYTELR